jgi:hypothetical protein
LSAWPQPATSGTANASAMGRTFMLQNLQDVKIRPQRRPDTEARFGLWCDDLHARRR